MNLGLNAPSDGFFSLGDTVSAELPPPPPDVYSYGTTSQPDVAVLERGGDSFFSGILRGVEATTNSLLNTWGRVNSMETNVAQQKFSQGVQRQQLDLQAAQVGGALDIAKTKVQSEQAIERLRAQTQVDIAAQQAVNARNGNYPGAAGKLDQWGLIIAAAGLFFTVMQLRKGKA